MRFYYVADRAALDDLDNTAVVLAGMDLGSKLGRSLVLLRKACDDPGLMDRVGQGLFTIGVSPGSKGRAGSGGVHVVRRADDDGIDVLLVDQLPVVVVFVRFGKVAVAAVEVVLVGITDSDNILRPHPADIRRGAILGADTADVELFAWSPACVDQAAAAEQHSESGKGAGFEKITTIRSLVHSFRSCGRSRFVDSLTSDKVIHSSQSVQPKSVEAGEPPAREFSPDGRL